MTPDGRRLDEEKIPHTDAALSKLIKKTPRGTIIVLETGTYGKPVAHAFRNAGYRVVLAEVREVRRRAGNDKKNDRRDAFELANQYRLGVIKEAYFPTVEEEAMRCIVRHRMDLSHKTARVKNQIHAQLGRNGLRLGFTSESLFGQTGLRYLGRAPLPPNERIVLDYHLRELELLSREIHEVDAQLANLAKDDELVRLAMTIRGVNYYSALIIKTELGDPSRFPSAKHVASYAGLVPREHQSGETHYRGKITKTGPSPLRWALVACTTSLIKTEGRFQRLYRRISRRRGQNRAKVAVAHKLLTIVWTLWTKKTEYAEKDEDLTYRKTARMRRLAKPISPRAPEEIVNRLLGQHADRILAERDGGVQPPPVS